MEYKINDVDKTITIVNCYVTIVEFREWVNEMWDKYPDFKIVKLDTNYIYPTIIPTVYPPYYGDDWKITYDTNSCKSTTEK